jgi:prephenate dehydrogenase
MKIFITGAGRMGSFFVEELCLNHELAVYDPDRQKLKHFYNVQRLFDLHELKNFHPEMVINAVSLHQTQEAFNQILPLINKDCLLVDLASVKETLPDYYHKCGMKFCSLHPMFGPTFAQVKDLSHENLILIKESDPAGKKFFTKVFEALKVNIFEYSFVEHDEVISYSLSIPFTSSMVFAACMKNQKAPGTTFKRHLSIAQGLLAEDDFLLSEIMFNPHTLKQIEKINSQLAYLSHIVKDRDRDEMQKFLKKLRQNIAQDL